MQERNFLLTIEYDGSEFCGWQRQPGVRTVQGVLEETLSAVCGAQVSLNGTSRTDAGVHALGQRASFRGVYGIPTEKIMQAANDRLCGGRRLGGKLGDVRITALEEKPLDFHARFDAKGKKYRYVIQNGGPADLFRRDYCYYVREALDIEEMRKGAAHIIGTHDFACFEAAGSQPRQTTVRTVYSLEICRRENDVTLEISGDGFLYNMVRIITGTLVEVGLERRTPQSVRETIAGQSRSLAGIPHRRRGCICWKYITNRNRRIEYGKTILGRIFYADGGADRQTLDLHAQTGGRRHRQGQACHRHRL